MAAAWNHLVLTGWVLTGLGVVLAGWALFFDRARGRLRCPRCWYDLAATAPRAAGATCPECGRRVATARAASCTRRHWRWALLGLLLMGSPFLAEMGQKMQREGWASVLSDGVLVRWPGVDARAWAMQRLDGAAPATGVPGEVEKRFGRMSLAMREAWLRRVARSINRFEGEDRRLWRAIPIFDLVEPTALDVEQYCYEWPSCFGEPPPKEAATSAQDWLANGVAAAIGMALLADDAPEDIEVVPIGGILLVSGSSQFLQHARAVLRLLRHAETEVELPGKIEIRSHDLDPIARERSRLDRLLCGGWPVVREWELPYDVSELVIELIEPTIWLDNGGTTATMSSYRRQLIVAATPDVQDQIRRVLATLADPATSGTFETTDDGRQRTVLVFDLSVLEWFDAGAPVDECSWVTPLEEHMDEVKDRLVATVEPELWLDNGGEQADAHSFASTLLVWIDSDLAPQFEAAIREAVDAAAADITGDQRPTFAES